MDMMHNARADIMFLNARVVCITHTAPHKAAGLDFGALPKLAATYCIASRSNAIARVREGCKCTLPDSQAPSRSCTSTKQPADSQTAQHYHATDTTSPPVQQ